MSCFEGLSNNQLLKKLRGLVAREHSLEAELVAHLAEVDARKLYLAQACSSMFHYCVRELGFAEGVAYKRIAVARASRKHPQLLRVLELGEVHLTGACLIAPHLDRENVGELLQAARGGTASQIKKFIANRAPKAAPTTSVRRVPSPKEPGHQSPSLLPQMTSTPLVPSGDKGDESTKRALAAVVNKMSAKPAREEPLGAERFNIRFVADQATHDQLQELRSLMRHAIPDGDVAKILARAVAELLERTRKKRVGSERAVSRPETQPRRKTQRAIATPPRTIPTAIRGMVWKRDSGQCTYRSREGKQCASRDYLEFHHQIPWARCHRHDAQNIYLRCRAHNQYEAELAFGTRARVTNRELTPRSD